MDDDIDIRLEYIGADDEIRWAVRGALDATGAEVVHRLIGPVVEAGRRVLLDLGRVRTIDGAGVSILIQLRLQAGTGGGRLRLILSEEIRRALDACRITATFELADGTGEPITPAVPEHAELPLLRAPIGEWEDDRAAQIGDELERAVLTALGAYGTSRRLTDRQRVIVAAQLRGALAALEASSEQVAAPRETWASVRLRTAQLATELSDLQDRHARAMATSAATAELIALRRAAQGGPTED